MSFSHLRELKLADEGSSERERIDLLIGANLYGSILLEGLKKGSINELIAQRTIFGWIVFGPCDMSMSEPLDPSKYKGRPSCFQLSVSCSLDTSLQKFWELEEVSSSENLTEDDLRCESIFTSSHSRKTDGRYVVRLPFKREAVSSFGNSFQIASKAFERLELRLSKNCKLSEAYHHFLREYETMGHMTPVLDMKDSEIPVYYMPHHPVLREDSTTSLLRVVFIASCVINTGTSLNEQLLTGSKLQADLQAILLRWRAHRLVLIADIEKMFRQILIHPNDANFQRILWRPNANDPITPYKLLTVTYGTACAPFLAMRVLKQLCLDEGAAFPLAVSVLENSTYVDDVLFGTHDVTTILEIREQLIALLKLGKFHLRK